ncbi:MAG: shikimate kinase [Oscillospiraceae bacterium]
MIATGGGCVTREENLPALRQNGRIIWLQRPLDSPDHPGRPRPRLWAWKNFTSPASPCMPVLPTMWSQTPGPWRIPSGRFWR